MRAMMQRLGVDTLELAYADLGGVYTEAARRCLKCENTAECLRWLDTDGSAAPPAFCPNLELFAALPHALTLAGRSSVRPGTAAPA
jgi:hypothetical protein